LYLFIRFFHRKIFKIVEEITISECRDLDAEMIELFQKWDFDTGGTIKRSTMAHTSLNAAILSFVTPYEKTFSFFSNKIYIEALLRKRKFEDFFSTCLDIAFAFSEFDSSRLFLKHIEMDGLSKFKHFIVSKIADVTSSLSNFTDNMSTNTTGVDKKLLEPVLQVIKTLRETLCSLIRLTGLFMKVIECKIKPEMASLASKCLSTFSTQMPLLTTSLLKAFGILERCVQSDGLLK
jgi:hypothetical protein